MVTKIWNPIIGCKHYCYYCWARRLAETRLRHLPKYRDGFEPKFCPSELKKTFRPGELVFVSDMGDMWGTWVPDEWILAVLDHVKKFPETTFLFLTKNPRRYIVLKDYLKSLKNIILGATVETNRNDYRNISCAPPPLSRLDAMIELRLLGFRNLMISIEPILDFDPEVFLNKILRIKPTLVYIGYDNYNNKLPEPPLAKTQELIQQLRQHKIEVRLKTIRKAWWENEGHQITDYL